MFGKYHMISITAIGLTYSTICLLNGLSPFFLFKSIIREDNKKISKKKTKKCKSKHSNSNSNNEIYEYINNLNLNKMSKKELIELKELLNELN